MRYYGAKELAESNRTVRKNTILIAEEIPEDQYNFRMTPDTRTVGEMLTHIALSPRIQYQVNGIEKLSTLQGFDFPSFFGKLMADAAQQRSKAEILKLLKDEGERIASWVEGLSEDFLGESVTMPTGATPASRTRFEMMLSMKEHEMHHRAQLMVAERMLGIVPHLTREMEKRIAAMTAAAAQPVTA